MTTENLTIDSLGSGLFASSKRGAYRFVFHWRTLESRESRLQGKDKELLLSLVQTIRRWLLDNRPSAQDVFENEFLVQHRLTLDQRYKDQLMSAYAASLDFKCSKLGLVSIVGPTTLVISTSTPGFVAA